MLEENRSARSTVSFHIDFAAPRLTPTIFPSTTSVPALSPMATMRSRASSPK
ncbi:hypothetical protein SBADM41S_06525 [Streptomyces badius]